MHALQTADVILYDALVGAEALELARREAQRIDVGKRAGRHSCRQDEIIVQMIDLARAGKRVVRLKSGDPMIFGRAAEEIDALREAGVRVDVVPGITAGLALAARLGASLTDRRTAHSVRFVTGHGKDGGLPPDMDWRGLADPETTLIVYMAGRTAGPLSRWLMAAGSPPHTPAVAAAGLGTANEQIVCCNLGELGKLVVKLGPDQPIIIGIGTAFAHPAAATDALILDVQTEDATSRPAAGAYRPATSKHWSSTDCALRSPLALVAERDISAGKRKAVPLSGIARADMLSPDAFAQADTKAQREAAAGSDQADETSRF